MIYVDLPSGHSLTSIPSGSYSATIVHACGYLGEELPSSFTSATRTPLKDTEMKNGGQKYIHRLLNFIKKFGKARKIVSLSSSEIYECQIGLPLKK